MGKNVAEDEPKPKHENYAGMADLVRRLADIEVKAQALIHDQGGANLEPLNEIVDVLRQAQEIIQVSMGSFSTTLENIPIGVFRNTPGPEENFLMANPAFLNLFGFDSIEELKQVTMADLYVDPSERQSFSDKLLAEKTVTGIELQLKKKTELPFTDWSPLE